MPSLAAVGAPRRERLLFTLTEQEKQLFFPGLSPLALFPDAHLALDPAARRPSAAEWLALLMEFQPTVLVSAWNTPPLPEKWLADKNFPLRYVCHVTGTVRALLPRSAFARGVLVTNWGGIAGRSVAEHALLLSLAALRNAAGWPEAVRRSRDQQYGNATARLGTRSLYGRHVGVHGFGQVARSLVRLLQPFEVVVHVFADGVPARAIEHAGARPCASVLELCSRSEVFYECEALTPARVGSVDAAALRALPDGAIFVNVARGALVDEAALLREAAAGRIRLALDVVVDDPVMPSDPLTGAPDAIISPHISGPTHDSFPLCGKKALANLRRFLAGEALEDVVTPDIYDRST